MLPDCGQTAISKDSSEAFTVAHTLGVQVPVPVPNPPGREAVWQECDVVTQRQEPAREMPVPNSLPSFHPVDPSPCATQPTVQELPHRCT